MSWIYLDNNATTKIDPAVLESMLPFLQESYGNASSIQHKPGREANQAIEQARRQIAQKFNVKDNEIFFNSGATEGINTVLRGVVETYGKKGKHIITCQTEHKAVLSTCAYLEKRGVEVSYLAVNANGEIDLQQLRDTIRKDTILVCIMAANNESGVVHPYEDIARICQEQDVLYCCDATQLVGKRELDLERIPIDILVFSAHKFHGPKGVGGLFIRRKTKPIQIPALVSGGKQEQGLRGGTLNVAAIVGCGKALDIARPHAQIRSYRDYLEEQIQRRVPQVIVHGKEADRLDNTSYIAFRHIRSAELMTSLPQLALSSGSACASGLLDPSHVLKAMGVNDDDAFSSIRISLSKFTERDEVERAVEDIIQTVYNVRQLSPIWKLFLDGLID
ncbi:cysteine desulfurase IscS [Sphingobacterium allocomposti]|uniref:cysteine desulfurase n=1 Tax=Sphingobacterium allocomposti TaxID=415956 RepID=A0A5S5DND5_9SPHI|nr:cysteine desulfurase family protein [Sphingobacterium composti Yoo et al. 2007 non Ten et al. 2007]TYP96888.1 cysteine desulfurase IscS [Sphingobacterium composti Yoo et al. 2007 non Ten et al. 2007]